MSSHPKRARISKNTLRVLEIYGKLCEQATRSPFGYTSSLDDVCFPRYETFVAEMPFPDGTLAGWILWLRYAYMGDLAENSDLDPEKPRDLRKMKERNFVRNPVWALSRALHELAGGRGDPAAEKSFQAAPHPQKTAAPAPRKLWVDTMTKAQMLNELMFYSGDFDYHRASSMDLFHRNNPGNPFNAMGLKMALDLAARAGVDVEYCREDTYLGVAEFPEFGQRAWRVRLNECIPQRLLQTFFPGRATPEWDIDDDGKRFLLQRYYDPVLADEKDEGFARFKANQSVRLNIQRSLLADAQSQSLEGVRAHVESMYEKELTPGMSFDEAAQVKLSIQRRGLEHFRTVFHPDGNLPLALKSLATAFQDTLDASPYSNFCMPLPRQFKNLTCLGENVAYITLSLEKTCGVNTLHRECLLATFCNYHVYFMASFHPHVLFLGDPMTGKSMIIKFRQNIMVVGTFKITDHISAQAFMAKDNSDIHFMILMSEEGEPSAVGNVGKSDKNSGSASSNMALTDKASAIRALMTSMYISYSRLVKKDETGDYQREGGVVQTNVAFCWAMNATGDDLAPNSRSRWLISNILSRPREGSSIQSKIVGNTGSSKSAEYKKFRSRMVRDQVVVGATALLLGCRVLDEINRTVTDAVFIEALRECAQSGLNGANDIRNFEKTRMVVDVVCVCRAMWEYFDSGLQGFKNQQEVHKDDDFIALGKLLETSTEDLVLAMTLTADQYEDPVMWDAVEAINRYMQTGQAKHPRPDDSKFYEKDKEADSKANQEGGQSSRAKPKAKAKAKAKQKAPPVPPLFNGRADEKGPSVAWVNDRQYADGKETKGSQLQGEIRKHQDQVYFIHDWSERMGPHITDPQRCNMLAERIRPLMTSKHSLAHVQSWIKNLYQETVEDDQRPGHMIPALSWPDTGSGVSKVMVAKKVLCDNQKNRLLRILARVVDHAGIPDIEFITGIAEMKTPFVMRTIIPRAVKEARLEAENKDPIDFRSMGLDSGKDEKHASPQKKKQRVRPKLMVRDPGWVDQSVTLYVQRALASHMTEDERDAVFRKSIPELFRSPYQQIDTSLEEYGTYRMLSDTKTHFETLRELGFGDVKHARKLIIRDTRYQLYSEHHTYDVHMTYPQCFRSRHSDFLRQDRWFAVGEEPRPAAVDEDSLEAMHRTHVPSELSMDVSRFRANVDPGYRDTDAYAQYQAKTTSIHKKTALIHAGLLRTRSAPTFELPVHHPPPAEEKKQEQDPDAEMEAELAAEEEEAEESDHEEPDDAPLPMDDGDETRSGFEPSAMAAFFGNSVDRDEDA